MPHAVCFAELRYRCSQSIEDGLASTDRGQAGSQEGRLGEFANV